MTDRRRQFRLPKVAEFVADELRRRILSGELADGASLENQDRLIAEFGVSRASLSEALRILETEGLITVRRGNRGGAVVHAPGAQISAYTLALGLESRAVDVEDVGQAMRQLEASCAAMAAARNDRAATVVPELESVNERAEAALEDFAKFVEVTAEFHERLVHGCGNATMEMVASAVESLWLAQVRAWAVEAEQRGSEPSLQYRRAGLEAHRRIVELIRRGDTEAVAALVRDHVEPRQFELAERLAHKAVRASVVRP